MDFQSIITIRTLCSCCSIFSFLHSAVLDTTLCDQVCQWLSAGWWFTQSTPVSSTTKTDHHDIAEILLEVGLNTITLTPDNLTFILLRILVLNYHTIMTTTTHNDNCILDLGLLSFFLNLLNSYTYNAVVFV
jgi:hypothetical protein